MKPTMTIFVCVLAAGLAAAQSPISVIENTRTTMNGVRDNSAAASNAALKSQGQGPTAPTATQAPSKSAAAPSVSIKAASTKTSSTASSKTATSATKPATKKSASKALAGTK